ncbi:lipid-binding SYLF domain-containing protein [Denitrobaculum tricleocarpae]|uniref:Lipid-binding SYLF domain-containing protein n=1 Tax=Denitrobaculum tricleocarpae TaxID=2591009 RepID=A0A545TGH3_9PROT|nr:lipid-binding SYLF domain-containing protein [Denitrobaculum tricleocarpae]TQV76329.1 lipid-binding SYLF domain-containing protein [Denitrobaculum tricleocarpae]
MTALTLSNLQASSLFKSLYRRILAVAALIGIALGTTTGSAVQAASSGEELVAKSRFTIERLLSDPEFFNLKRYIEQSRGVLIIPELVKGGFIVGGEGGSGVLMVKGSDGTWSSPAFYTLAAGSIGLQIGGQVSEVVFTLMNDGAVNSMLGDEFKLGADASVAVGPIGAGLEASTTTNLNQDIYAFSKSVGLFGGGALEGAKIFERVEWNEGYYGKGATPKAIVFERRFSNPDADRLRAALASTAAPAAQTAPAPQTQNAPATQAAPTPLTTPAQPAQPAIQAEPLQ